MQALAKPAYPQLNLGHPLSRGLTYAWSLSEGAGGQVNDLVTGLNKGTINNGAPWVGSPYGSALSFNGSSQWVSTQKNSGVTTSPLTSFSIAYLVYWASNPAATQEVVTARSGVGASPGVFSQLTNSGQIDFGLYDGASFPSLITSSLSAGNWHHVVGTWTGATGTQTDAALYVDGISHTNVLGTGFASVSASYPWSIAWEGTQTAFVGSVALLLVYNRALSAAEAQQLYFDPFVVFRPRSRWWEVLATAAVTPNWGYENEPTFPERRRAQRMLLQDEPIWPRTVVATPTQFGWDNPEQFAKRQIIRGLSRQDVDPTTVPSIPPVTQFGWDNPEKFAIRSRRGTFQNQDDEFKFTAVPTPTQLSFPWEPQFPVRRKIDALQSPDDEFLLTPGTPTPTQQGFDWHPQFPVRKRFTTFQSPDDEFKFTAVATPTQFGWYIDPQFAERRKHRLLINPADDEWLFTAIKTPTQLGWHTDPQFARRLKLLLKLWEEEGDGPFKPPAGAVANVQHLLMLLGFGR